MAAVWKTAKAKMGGAFDQGKKQGNIAAMKAKKQLLVQSMTKKKSKFGKEIYDFMDAGEDGKVQTIFNKYKGEIDSIKQEIHDLDEKIAALKMSGHVGEATVV